MDNSWFVCFTNLTWVKCWYGRYAWNYGPNILTNKCDLLIAIEWVDDRVTGDPSSYASQAKIIHLEIDPAEVDNIKVDVPVIGKSELKKMITDKIDKRSHVKMDFKIWWFNENWVW